MMKRKMFVPFLMCLAIAVIGTGCGKKADPNKPIDQVKAEVEKMSVSDLEATARAYAKEIAAKKGKVDEIQAKLKGLSPMEVLGEKGSKIRDEAAQVATQVSALTERYEVYASKFQQSGGDLSKIKID